MKKKFYMVTGGTGFIGNSLVRRLVRDGYGVRVMDNDLRGAEERLTDILPKIELVKADVRDARVVEDACRGVDGVIHLAYLNGTEFFYKFPELVLDIGVKGMINVIDACIKNKVRELILASSSEVYQTPPMIPTDESAPLCIPDPLNPRYSYGGGKILSELMAINYGRKHFDRVLIFRPHNVYGPDMGWGHVMPQFIMRMKRIVGESRDKNIKFLVQGSGKETRAFIYIDDFIDGLMLVLEKGEHLNIYHIGTMDEISIAKVAEEIGACFGRQVKIIPGALTEGSTPRRCPDIAKLRKLGFSPKISLGEGIGKTVSWYKEHEPLRKKLTQ